MTTADVRVSGRAQPEPAADGKLMTGPRAGTRPGGVPAGALGSRPQAGPAESSQRMIPATLEAVPLTVSNFAASSGSASGPSAA